MKLCPICQQKAIPIDENAYRCTCCHKIFTSRSIMPSKRDHLGTLRVNIMIFGSKIEELMEIDHDYLSIERINAMENIILGLTKALGNKELK